MITSFRFADNVRGHTSECDNCFRAALCAPQARGLRLSQRPQAEHRPFWLDHGKPETIGLKTRTGDPGLLAANLP
jgi:hypothetical protein